VAPVNGAASHKPRSKAAKSKQAAAVSDGDSDEQVEVVAAPAAAASGTARDGETSPTQAMADFVATAKGLLKTIGILSKDVKKLNKKVETQGKNLENLTVSMNKMQTAPKGNFGPDVEEEENYSDYEEMKAFIGTGVVGKAVLSTTSAAAADHGKRLTLMQEGTLKMLRVRRRVKIRTYGRVGTATSTRNVIHDSEADWALMVEETMDELRLDERDANEFLLSTISAPTTRKASAKNEDAPKALRAYQPVLQCISHALEEMKKKAVAAWHEEVHEKADAMTPAGATVWLSNCRIEVGGPLLVKPRFEASERGVKGIVAAVKAIFVYLTVRDRIKEPAQVGDSERVTTTWGHVALAASFVCAELEKIEAGGKIRRTGVDGGCYDRWRWEVLALKAFVPISKTPWHGLVIDDSGDDKLFEFPQAPVVFSGSRTLAALAAAVAAATAAADAAAEALATVTNSSAMVEVGAEAAAQAAAAAAVDPATEAPAQSGI